MICPKCKGGMFLDILNGWKWMCMECGYVRRSTIDAEYYEFMTNDGKEKNENHV